MITKRCNSFIDFIKCVEEDCNFFKGKENDQVFIFRGHSNLNFKLVPGSFRGTGSNEFSDCHNIEIEYPEEFDKSDHLSSLAKMQHYGIKTRLLDFTRNPLVALYIAAYEKFETDGAVYVIKTKKEFIKHHFSDTILCLSCLSFLKKEDKVDLLKYCKSNKNQKLDKNSLEKHDSIRHLYHEIRSQYPTFEYEINSDDLLKFRFVAANKDNARIKAQDGLFAIFGLDERALEDQLDNQQIFKIIISKNAKKDIINSLEKYGISDSKLYLGLDRDSIKLYKNYFKAIPILNRGEV